MTLRLKQKLADENRLYCYDCMVFQSAWEFKLDFRKRHAGHHLAIPRKSRDPRE